jgi:hypothetical protein
MAHNNTKRRLLEFIENLSDEEWGHIHDIRCNLGNAAYLCDSIVRMVDDICLKNNVVRRLREYIAGDFASGVNIVAMEPMSGVDAIDNLLNVVFVVNRELLEGCNNYMESHKNRYVARGVIQSDTFRVVLKTGDLDNYLTTDNSSVRSALCVTGDSSSSTPQNGSVPANSQNITDKLHDHSVIVMDEGGPADDPSCKWGMAATSEPPTNQDGVTGSTDGEKQPVDDYQARCASCSLHRMRKTGKLSDSDVNLLHSIISIGPFKDDIPIEHVADVMMSIIDKEQLPADRDDSVPNICLLSGMIYGSRLT